MKNLTKTLFLIITLSFIITSCSNDDDNSTTVIAEPEVVVSDPIVTSEPDIVTPDPIVMPEPDVVTPDPIVTPEPDVVTPDPVVTPEPTEPLFKFEAGNYNISWEGSPFKTVLTKTDENTLTGRFCLNNNLSNCEDIGPITITRDDENKLTFSFSDINCRIQATNLPGEFNGSGTLTKDNIYNFIVNGEDCKRVYTNNNVIFTKI